MRIYSVDGVCEYCGVAAEEVDHIPALSVRARMAMAPLPRGVEYLEVDTCRHCNLILKDRPLLEFRERRAFVKKALKRKYAKLLSQPRWDPEELNELGPGLRQAVISAQAAADVIRGRIAWERPLGG